MPVFDGEEFLGEALDSLFRQEYEPLEIVVCDDGSTDRTPEILDAHQAVRVVRQENRGAAAARNAAVAASTGDLLAFFDADDLWPANRIALQVDYLLEHPEAGCVLGRQEWMNPPPWLTPDPVWGDLDGVPLLSAMIRRDAFESLGGFDPSFRVGEDTDLLIRMRERGIGIDTLPVVILYRRFHGRNLTAAHESPAALLRSLHGKLRRDRGSAQPGR